MSLIKIYEVLANLKNKNLQINIILIGNHTHTNDLPDFEQKYYSRTTDGIYKFRNDSIRIMNCIVYFETYFENINYYDLMASVLGCPNEISL